MAQESAPPPTVAEVADALSADGATLDAVEGLDAVDPWPLAYELCLRGEFDLAAAVAKHRESADTAGLPAYVEACRSAAPTDLREQLDAARNAETPEAAIAALEGIELKPDVASITAARLRLSALSRLRRTDEVATLSVEIADAAEQLGWLTASESALFSASSAYQASSRFDDALAVGERRLELATRRGDIRTTALAHEAIAYTSIQRGGFEPAIEHLRAAIGIYERLEDRRELMGALTTLGIANYRWRNDAEATAAWERAAELAAALGDRRNQAGLTVNLGNIAKRAGDLDAAADAYSRGAELAAASGSRRNEATALDNLAGVYEAQGRYREALELFDRARAIAEELGIPRVIANILSDIGVVHRSLGDFETAVEFQTRALAIHERGGDRMSQWVVRKALGLSEMQRGANATALAHFEAAVALGKGNRHAGQTMDALYWQAWVLNGMNAADQALAAQAEMEAIARGREHARSIGRALRLKALLADDPNDAIALFHEAAEIDPNVALYDRQHLATYYLSAKRYEDALALFQEIVAEYPEDAALQQVKAQVNIASSLRGLGRTDEALDVATSAFDAAMEIGATRVALRALSVRSHVHFLTGNHAGLVEVAKSSVALEPLLVTGLSESLAAEAREANTTVREQGIRAAAVLGRVEDAFHLLESARGAALLEALGGRTAVRSDLLPPDLLEQEKTASGNVREARARLETARASRKLKAVREARAALDEAEAALLQVADRIQRAGKTASSALYPSAIDLAAFQAVLQPGEAYLGLTHPNENLTAVVVTRDDARVLTLEDGTELIAAAASLEELSRRGSDTTAAIERLRDGLGTAIALPEGTKRLLVIPTPMFALVPFGLVFPGQEIAYIPSGSVLARLRADATPAAQSILGVGDPAYPTRERKGPSQRAGVLTRLPGTRVEVEAVADVKLLGEDATEEQFRSKLADRERWRAIHFACHGLVEPSEPLLSSLALTVGEESDGFLTVHELFRMRLPADLVTLSACETAKGELYYSEGVLGFARAILIAGSPRALVSLWKVDDEATRALMVKFYELWNPDEGTGLSTAAALRAAQQHVRSQEAWSDPYFWAAWTLWGLPE